VEVKGGRKSWSQWEELKKESRGSGRGEEAESVRRVREKEHRAVMWKWKEGERGVNGKRNYLEGSERKRSLGGRGGGGEEEP
jgi:hypothetical protein